MREKGYPGPMLVDQGAKDQFLDLLKPEALVAAAATRRQPMQFRMTRATTTAISTSRA